MHTHSTNRPSSWLRTFAWSTCAVALMWILGCPSPNHSDEHGDGGPNPGDDDDVTGDDDDATADDDDATADDDDATADDDDDTMGTCGPPELCERSIADCGVAMGMPQCLDWYDDDGNCTNMTGYIACNCDCIGEPVCDDYFVCGEVCFNQFCN